MWSIGGGFCVVMRRRFREMWLDGVVVLMVIGDMNTGVGMCRSGPLRVYWRIVLSDDGASDREQNRVVSIGRELQVHVY